MRQSAKHKEETHRRIVETASARYREHGFEGVGIARLMNELGLTHGGFYAHFQDKEDLVAEASALALEQSRERMEFALREGGIRALIDLYLSEEHRQHPEFGCPLPALAAEVARRPLHPREAFQTGYDAILDVIAGHVPGETPKARRAEAHFLMSTMTGAIALARSSADPRIGSELLAATRDRLIRLYA